MKMGKYYLIFKYRYINTNIVDMRTVYAYGDNNIIYLNTTMKGLSELTNIEDIKLEYSRYKTFSEASANGAKMWDIWMEEDGSFITLQDINIYIGDSVFATILRDNILNELIATTL